MKKIITISLILVMSFLMQGCNIFSVENPNEDYKYTSFTAAEKNYMWK